MPASSPHDRAIRWRQLVELAARSSADSAGEIFDEAITAIREGLTSIEERVRIAAALAVAAHPLPPELVAVFASDRLAVAAPVLASARLTATEWKQVAQEASPDCRAFVASMRSDEPPAPVQHRLEPLAAAVSGQDQADHPPIPSISEVVARIERLRTARDGGYPDDAGEDGGPPSLFRWECNETGDIDWVEGAPRGALVGQSIAHHGTGTGVDRTVERAFAARAPFHDGLLELPADAVVGGSWKISGVPAFERSSGRFAGYRGIAERTETDSEGGNDPASLRELAHEIRTPLNAIIGFAEMIAGEYLGPADSRYRDRAANIVAQARLLLTAIEDLDFAARLRSGEVAPATTDIGALAEALAGAIRETASDRGVEVSASRPTTALPSAIDRELAERLILRMCGAVIDRATDGEELRLSVDRESTGCSVSIARPNALSGLSDDELFGTESDAMSPSFPLRLVRGLAQAAGADLVTGERGITLTFPPA